MEMLLSRWYRFCELSASFIYWLSGDLWLGEDYRGIHEELQSGRILVTVTHIPSGITVSQSGEGFNLRSIKRKLSNELDNMVQYNAL